MQAEIYIPPELDVWQWTAACAGQAEVLGLPVRGVVDDWAELVQLLHRCPWCGHGGEADVAITPTRAALPADRLPRLIVVEEQPRPVKLMPTHRVPRQRGQAEPGGGRPPRKGRSG